MAHLVADVSDDVVCKLVGLTGSGKIKSHVTLDGMLSVGERSQLHEAVRALLIKADALQLQKDPLAGMYSPQFPSVMTKDAFLAKLDSMMVPDGIVWLALMRINCAAANDLFPGWSKTPPMEVPARSAEPAAAGGKQEEVEEAGAGAPDDSVSKNLAVFDDRVAAVEALVQPSGSSAAAAAAAAGGGGTSIALDDLVSRVFAGDAVMPFANWAEAVLPHLITGLPPSAAVSTLACVRDLAADANSLLQRDSTGKLISWFLPLRRDDVPPAPGQAAWRVSDMLALLDTPTFVGFASATEAKDWVVRQDEVGAFLFRFSSQVGMYGLSACWQRGHVGHWRISTAVVSGVPVFTMNSREYSSLQDIIRTHSHPGTPLSAKDSAGVAVNFYLSVAITKRDVLESKESADM